MPEFTFADVTRVTAEIHNHFPTYTRFFGAYLYASGIPGRTTVLVPLELGVDQVRSLDDINTDYWLPREGRQAHLVDMAQHRVVITHMNPTRTAQVPLKHSYVIHYVAQTRTHLGQNIALPHVIPGLTRPWFGNILVVKCGRRNAVVGMRLDDSALVDALVAMAIENNLLT